MVWSCIVAEEERKEEATNTPQPDVSCEQVGLRHGGGVVRGGVEEAIVAYCV